MAHVTQALIAGGTFNGDVYIWDLSQEGDMQRAKTDALSDLRHREPVVSLVWQYSMSEYNKYGDRTRAYRLVTLGADGLVMVWKWHKLSTALYGYRMQWMQPGSSTKVKRPSSPWAHTAASPWSFLFHCRCCAPP